jgi:radical SAM PhpK family P-methyltransferase
MIDCLLVGFNDYSFEDYVKMVRSMGTDSGAYRDLSLAFIECMNKPYRALDILTHFYSQDKKGVHKPFHNADFLWPVITYLGTYLSRRGFEFDYVNLFHIEKDRLKEKLTENDVLAVAITTTMYVSPHPIWEIISLIREYNDTARIIVGGPYILNQAIALDRAALEAHLDYIGADLYVVNSEGEFALVNILNALKNGQGLDDIDNIAYRTADGRYVITSSSKEDNPLRENMIDYGLFLRDEIGEFVSLRTSKSCPFNCAFCGFPQRAGKYRFMSVDSVDKELNAIRDAGLVTTLTFIDDTFNVPKKRFKELLRMIIKNQYRFKWNCMYRCDHGDEETIELMAEAGCEGVFLGVESGNDTMLQRMNKSAGRKDYLKAIPLFREVGILTHANLIVGFPGETYETVQETIDLIEEVKPDFFRAQLWYCDPTTPIWNKREEYGVRGSAFNWSHNTMDSQTACDLVEKMFLCVENSTWLPQYGFELWSVFYLQRKGMAIEQVNTFVKCFNACIKEKLVYPNKKDIAPDLIESLRTSCQFDGPARPDMRPIELFSGSRYVAAEQFWVKEFSNGFPASNIKLIRDEVEAADDGWVSVPFTVEQSVLDGAQFGCQAELSDVILAAYSVLLSRLNGREDTVIVSALSGNKEGVVPMRLYSSWDLSFGEFAQNVQQKILQAMEHQLYAFHILTNPLRMAEHNGSCPVFDVGYMFCESEGEREGGNVEEVLKLYPAVNQGIGLVLKVAGDGDNINTQFSYKRSWFRQKTAEKLGSYLVSILKEVSENPDVLLGEIVLDSERESRDLAGDADASKVFNF